MPIAAAHAAAAERRLQEALPQAQERRAEQERLPVFLDHAGMDAGVWPAFTRLLRTVSGKTVEYGGQSPAGNGLLVYSGPHPGQEFRLAGVMCPPAARRDLTRPHPPAARSPLTVAVLNPTTQHCTFLRIRPQPPA
ncbi:hypothetical protein [Streptomyces sp. PanSC9]|uniref:hypothetical protein n=1 Tax=Streptomyces sp. PanSC9 TaxID=1520461 RepID=UPI000FA60154|nr:hypothetical protein [Streptomyces sp. PanSC9]ROP55946.1 hypothetical protein EDD94_5526 [Streptomyces sp. PanSC9]